VSQYHSNDISLIGPRDLALRLSAAVLACTPGNWEWGSVKVDEPAEGHPDRAGADLEDAYEGRRVATWHFHSHGVCDGLPALSNTYPGLVFEAVQDDLSGGVCYLELLHKGEVLYSDKYGTNYDASPGLNVAAGRSALERLLRDPKAALTRDEAQAVALLQNWAVEGAVRHVLTSVDAPPTSPWDAVVRTWLPKAPELLAGEGERSLRPDAPDPEADAAHARWDKARVEFYAKRAARHQTAKADADQPDPEFMKELDHLEQEHKDSEA
jgi:hypothetical protein